MKSMLETILIAIIGLTLGIFAAWLLSKNLPIQPKPKPRQAMYSITISNNSGVDVMLFFPPTETTGTVFTITNR